jgi:hypothetical protein
VQPFFIFLFARPPGGRQKSPVDFLELLSRRSVDRRTKFRPAYKAFYPARISGGPSGLINDTSPRSAKVGLENQDEQQEQREQSSGDCQQEEKNDRNSVLSGGAQSNAASYDDGQNGKDRQPGQNVE